MDEFDFDPAPPSPSLSLQVTKSVGSSSSDRDSLAPLRTGGGKTKAARLKLRKERVQQEIEKSVRFSIEDSERESIDSIVYSNRSQSVGSRKPTSRRRTKTRDASSLNSHNNSICSSLTHLKENQSPLSSSSVRSSLSSLENQRENEHDVDEGRVQVKGAGLNVLAVQDAGSYRMLLDECLYLTSTICTGEGAINQKSRSSESALWDLALMLSKRDNRNVLWSSSETPLDSILNVLASTPSSRLNHQQYQSLGEGEHEWNADHSLRHGSTNRLYQSNTDAASPSSSFTLQGLTRLGYEGLSTILHFLSIDCTVSLASSSSNAAAARAVRRKILRNGAAMRGMSRLMLFAPSPPADDEASCSSRPQEMHAVDEFPDPRLSIPSCASSVTSSSRGSIRETNCEKIQTVESKSTSKRKIEDPTSVGRKIRQRLRHSKRQPQQLQDDTCSQAREHGSLGVSTINVGQSCHHDPWSFSDGEGNASKWLPVAESSLKSVFRIAETVKRKVGWSDRGCACQKKLTSSHAFAQTVALEALHRIIQGKEEGEETSCLDDEEDNTDEGVEDEGDDEHNPEGVTTNNDFGIEASNPLVVTNKLLLDGGVLPMFSSAMAEALNDLGHSSTMPSPSCQACLFQTRRRIIALASLVDGACLLSDDNREELCLSGSLISSLLQLLRRTLTSSCSTLFEFALVSMRTLTSLTHENALAGRQLEQSYLNDDEQHRRMQGIEIVLHLLFRTVVSNKGKGNDDRSRQEYDIVIFCLNTLTNVIETAHLQSTLSILNVPSVTDDCKIGEEAFLPWLTRWIVEETSSFRESVLNGSFGNKNGTFLQNEGNESYLHKDAEEHLVTAGNGFILLSCVIIQGDGRIRESVLVHTKNAGGYTLIINTLKAFCNFYYYSVGDLSVAVVAPVKKLIAELVSIADSS
jgi:hypothetical protein